MTKVYEYGGRIVEIGQIVTHDLYDGCLLQMLVGEVFDSYRFSYGEDDDCQYATITLCTKLDRRMVTDIMSSLDGCGVYYETDFELPTTEK